MLTTPSLHYNRTTLRVSTTTSTNRKLWHTIYQKDRREWNNSFSRLFGKSWQQQTTDYSLKKTHAYGQTTARTNHPTIQRHTKPPSKYWPCRRAQLICDSPNALRNENDYLQRVFHKNNYKPDFVKLDTYKNNEFNETNNLTTVTATIPYIKGTSEIISRILRPYNIRVAQTRHNFTTYTN